MLASHAPSVRCASDGCCRHAQTNSNARCPPAVSAIEGGMTHYVITLGRTVLGLARWRDAGPAMSGGS